MDIHFNSSSTLLAVQSKVPHFSSLGIKALHLRNILIHNFSLENGMSPKFYPTSHAINIFKNLNNSVGVKGQLEGLTMELHKHNMTLIVQIPVLEDGILFFYINVFVFLLYL